MTPLTSSEIQHIAVAAAEEAIRKLLITMGVDASDPEALIEMQKDFAHMRKWRKSVDSVGPRALLAAVGVIVTFALGALFSKFH